MNEYQLGSKDFVFEINAYPTKDGLSVFAKDITKRKQMEMKLQEYSEHLEELVEKRTRQLKEAQEQLLKAERLAAIGEMAAMIGHDLRNPLTSIAGATYYLKTKLGPKMDKKAREMLELVEKNVEYSNKIISDLLEYSRKIRLELKETTSKMVKIMITGYPSLPNAIEAVNKGADAYILKPFDMDNVLNKIKKHLKKQQEAKKYSQEKVTEFIETRVKGLEEETVTHKKPR